MVINEIITGISLKIKEIFGDGYHVYDDGVEQGLEKPCFFINYLDGEETRQIGLEIKSYLDTLHFDVTGFAENDDRPSLNDMADKLYYLKYIKLNNGILIRADSLKPTIKDNVLHFFIDYKIFINKKDTESTKMGEMNYNEEVKNNG